MDAGVADGQPVVHDDAQPLWEEGDLWVVGGGFPHDVPICTVFSVNNGKRLAVCVTAGTDKRFAQPLQNVWSMEQL